MTEKAKAEHATLHDALLAVQAELPKPMKSGDNPHFGSKFVPLDVLMDAVLPVLNRHGLTWVTMPTRTPEGAPALWYRLSNGTGAEDVESTMLLLAAKDDPQGQGAAITYARRYALTAVLGITADEDDDGNKATAARQRQRPAPVDPDVEIGLGRVVAMREAIVRAGKDVQEVLQAAGIEDVDRTTNAQAKRVKELIA